MFRKHSIFAGAVMVTLSASSACAAFADLRLVRVIYKRTTGATESATDLGDINTLLGSSSATITGPALAASTPANLFAVYFAINHTGSGAGRGVLWVSSTPINAPVAVGTIGFSSAKANTTSVG